MKNDFREFYDEDYILHKAMEGSSEDELMHGEWLNKFRRYVDKVKTASGKWRYIYPEDLKKAGEKIKRDVSYAARNVASKVTGKNKRFGQVAAQNISKKRLAYKHKKATPNYERIQRNARKDLTVSQRRNTQLAAANANKQYYDQGYIKSQRKEAIKRKSNQLHAAYANKKYYDKGSSDYRTEQIKNKTKSAIDSAKAARMRRERQLAAANANKQYYDKNYANQLKKKEAYEWNQKVKKRRNRGSHRG